MTRRWWAERGDLGVAALSGGVLVLAFPSADLGGLAFVALVPWLARLADLGPRPAAFSGLVAGLAFFLGSLWWIAGTMLRYGDVPPGLAVPVAVAILVLLAGYLSLFYTRYGDVFARTLLAAALLGLLGVRLGRAARALRLRTTSRPEGVA